MDAKKIFDKSSRSFFLFMILTMALPLTQGCSSGDDSTPTDGGTTTEQADGGTTTEQAADQTLDRSLISNYNSETYPLKIFLPAVFKTDKNLPVIYLTDGLFLFELLKQKTKEIGLQAIIVAIGDKEGSDRIRDYAPSFCGGGANDGFENFYNLITQQLVPFVDNNYENDHSSRSLIGYSFGGRFAVAALLMEDPEAVIFHGSIAVDPAFACEADSFIGLINVMSNLIDSTNSIESFKLFRTRSGEFEPDGFNEYMEVKAMELPWFEFDFMDLENEDHESVIGPSFVAGLRYVYDIN